jgi:hypothetical protein
MPEFDEALARLSPKDIEQAAEAVALPEELKHLLQESAEADQRAEALAEQMEEVTTEERQQRIPILKLVASLNVAQKIALAIKGNKEARTLLVRDRNRIVAAAAIRNPRTTEQELVTAAQSRSVCDEVIRIIANSKEMSRAYMVKRALVYNPKTPTQVATRFLPLLRASDLKAIAKSRNVSNAVSTQAKRLVQRAK